MAGEISWRLVEIRRSVRRCGDWARECGNTEIGVFTHEIVDNWGRLCNFMGRLRRGDKLMWRLRSCGILKRDWGR
jgi:hypothetical protein